jgi:hypothetical protein
VTAAVWGLLLVRPRRESFSTDSVVGPGSKSASVSHRSWLRSSAHLFLASREEGSKGASKRCCPLCRAAVESCIGCTNPMAISAFGAGLIEQRTQGATSRPGLTSGNNHPREDGSSCTYCNSRELQACKPDYVKWWIDHVRRPRWPGRF